MIAGNIIIKPIISERSMKDANTGKFTFIVVKSATKQDIKKAIESLFSVNVLSVATATVKGRSTRAGARRQEVILSPIKKAILKLKSGQKIAAFEVGA